MKFRSIALRYGSLALVSLVVAKSACADVVSDMTGTISTAINEVGTSQVGILLAALGISLGFLIYVIVRKCMSYGKKS